MTDERKLILSNYVINLVSRTSCNLKEKIKYVSMFLECEYPLTRKGFKEFATEHTELMISGPYPGCVRNAIDDFLKSIGKGNRRRKKQQAENVEALEKLSVISGKNLNHLRDFMLSLENERDYSRYTLAAYKNSITDFYRYSNELTQDNARRYIKALEDKGYKPQTLRLRITSLEKYGEFMHKTIKILRPKYQRSLSTENIPTEKDYHILLDYLKEKNMKYYYWVRLLATTGARVSEFVQFTFEDVIRGETTIKGKGSKYRRFFFQKGLQNEIRRYAADNNLSGYIAISKYGNQITTRGIAALMKVWAEKTGIAKEKMHPHAFRHLFAKLFLKKNKNVVELAELLGHGNIETTRIYLQKSLSEQKNDFNRNVTW